jgi:octaprenyl-diphosphate synthase
MELKEIFWPIEKDLQKVETRLQEVLNSQDKSVAKIGRYLLRSRGKRLRPALTLLSSRMGKTKRSQAIDLAASIELVHTATLVHDDVIDNATLRRKQPALNVKFGPDMAILFGDFLFSKSFKLLSALKIPKITSVLLQATNTVCRGEMQQLNKVFRPVGENEYIKVVARKTAALFSASAEAGGILGDVSNKKMRALQKYGHNLGISFQIVDDCLDFIGDEKKTGKTGRLDAKSGKMTLPVIHLRRFSSKSPGQAINYSLSVAKKYGGRALKELDVFEDGNIRQCFTDLIQYIIEKVN